VYGKMKPTLYSDLISSVRSLVFFGTPHQGADIATWGTFLSHVSTAFRVRSTQALEELGKWSPTLLQLNTLFAEQAADQNVTTFFERQKTYGVMVCYRCYCLCRAKSNHSLLGRARRISPNGECQERGISNVGW
jgi:hypothetical protein